MKITVTLSQTDLARLAEIRKLIESQGRPWYGIEAAVACALSSGIYNDLTIERSHAETIEASDAPALLARQAS